MGWRQILALAVVTDTDSLQSWEVARGLRAGRVCFITLYTRLSPSALVHANGQCGAGMVHCLIETLLKSIKLRVILIQLKVYMC